MITDTMLTTAIETLQNLQLKVNTNAKHRLYVFIETLKKCATQDETEKLTAYETLQLFKKQFGVSQGYEEDIDTQIEAYEYVIEVEHNKDDELMDADFFEKFDDTLQAIAKEVDGQYTVNKQAYENFKNQILDDAKISFAYPEDGTLQFLHKWKEMTENTSVCLTQGLDDTIDAPVIVPCKPPPCPEFGTGDLSDVPTYPKEEKEAFDYSDECVDPACYAEDYPQCCEPEVPDCCEDTCEPPYEEILEEDSTVRVYTIDEPGCPDECTPETMPFPEEDDNPLGLARCMECGTLFDTTPKDILNNCKKTGDRRCWKCKKIISIVQLKAQVKD
jgi:predicted  nucleic acid-binding Zn-ribbon protein